MSAWNLLAINTQTEELGMSSLLNVIASNCVEYALC